MDKHTYNKISFMQIKSIFGTLICDSTFGLYIMVEV